MGNRNYDQRPGFFFIFDLLMNLIKKSWGHHFGNIKMQWENYSKLLPEPMNRHFRSSVALSHSQFYVHSLVQLNRGRPSSSFMHAALPPHLPRKNSLHRTPPFMFPRPHKTAGDSLGARLQRPASQHEETQEIYVIWNQVLCTENEPCSDLQRLAEILWTSERVKHKQFLTVSPANLFIAMAGG